MIEFSYEDIILTKIPPKEFYKTGTKMDNISGGIAKGEIHCICGSTGSGKSMTLMHVALNSCIEGYKCCIIALENDYPDDIERIKEANDIYCLYINENLITNFKYYNIQNEKDAVEKIKFILEKMQEFDIVFVDGTEFLITGTTPTEISANGRKLMMDLRMAARQTNTSLVMSWQTNRPAGGKKFEELCAEDLSGSLSVPQQCYTIWILKQWVEANKMNWKMKLVKNRSKYDFSKSTFAVLDENKQFNLR